ncbi:MAG: ABC transporter permease [Clostridiales bacterium]|nr:ABC transporter permease [Clostridiales bacterium]
MQVFKTYMKIFKKTMPSALIYIVIFIIIGFLVSSSSSDVMSFKDTSLDVTVVDNDNTAASKALKDYIGSKHKLMDDKKNKDEYIDSLYYNITDYVLIINKGYSENLSAGITDNLFQNYKLPSSYEVAFIENQLDEYVRVVNSYTVGGLSIDEAALKPLELSKDPVNVKVVNFTNESDGDINPALVFYYQYLAYILPAVLIIGVSAALIIMRKKDVRNRTNCSCVSNSSQFFQTMLGTSIVVIGIYLLLTVVAFIIYGSDMLSKPVLLAMLNGFVFLIISMMITLLVSILAKTQKVVSMVANTICLGMSFLCGVFVPQHFLSDSVLSFAKFFPSYWYVKANNMIFGTSSEIFTMNKYFTYVGIEVGFAVAILCVTLMISKTKQKSKAI